jgi:hypothetical protein
MPTVSSARSCKAPPRSCPDETLIVECDNFELGGIAERFPSFCAHIKSLSFRGAVFGDPLHVSPHHMPSQFDLLFLRQSRVGIGDRTAPLHGGRADD